MTSPPFSHDYTEIYRSEVLGGTLFGVAAWLSVGRRRRCWRRLQALEAQTLRRYLDFTRQKQLFPAYPLCSFLGGLLFGLVFAVLPWRAAMKALRGGTPELVELFRAMHEASDADDRAFFAYVLAHEQAIAGFAESELAGDAAAAAAQLDALLESPSEPANR